jgi:hypothetical protein
MTIFLNMPFLIAQRKVFAHLGHDGPISLTKETLQEKVSVLNRSHWVCPVYLAEKFLFKTF